MTGSGGRAVVALRVHVNVDGEELVDVDRHGCAGTSSLTGGGGGGGVCCFSERSASHSAAIDSASQPPSR